MILNATMGKFLTNLNILLATLVLSFHIKINNKVRPLQMLKCNENKTSLIRMASGFKVSYEIFSSLSHSPIIRVSFERYEFSPKFHYVFLRSRT